MASSLSYIPKAGNKTPWFGRFWSGAVLWYLDDNATDKWQFHFNTSFANINLAKVACEDLGIPFSISFCKSVIHNAYMLERFICVSGLRPEPHVIDKLFKELVLFTSRAA